MQITEYIEPYSQRFKTAEAAKTVNSSFLDTFYETPYPQIPRKL
jgi:hypothetical protein